MYNFLRFETSITLIQPQTWDSREKKNMAAEKMFTKKEEACQTLMRKIYTPRLCTHFRLASVMLYMNTSAPV